MKSRSDIPTGLESLLERQGGRLEPALGIQASAAAQPVGSLFYHVGAGAGQHPFGIRPQAYLEAGMAIRSSINAWGIPRTEEPGGLLSKQSQRETTE